MMQESRANSYLFGGNAPYVEELYERYLADPDSVDPSWRATFDAWQKGGGNADVPHSPVIAAFDVNTTEDAVSDLPNAANIGCAVPGSCRQSLPPNVT